MEVSSFNYCPLLSDWGENIKNGLQSDLEFYKCMQMGRGCDGEGIWDISSCVEISEIDGRASQLMDHQTCDKSEISALQ